jgi:hypothetical protein
VQKERKKERREGGREGEREGKKERKRKKYICMYLYYLVIVVALEPFWVKSSEHFEIPMLKA